MPSMYSITRYLCSVSTETSRIATMFGCESIETARDSFTNRVSASGSPAISSRSIFIATVSSCFMS